MQRSSNERQSGLSQHNSVEIRKLSGGKRGGTGGLHIFPCSEADEESSEGVRRIRQGRLRLWTDSVRAERAPTTAGTQLMKSLHSYSRSNVKAPSSANIRHSNTQHHKYKHWCNTWTKVSCSLTLKNTLRRSFSNSAPTRGTRTGIQCNCTSATVGGSVLRICTLPEQLMLQIYLNVFMDFV